MKQPNKESDLDNSDEEFGHFVEVRSRANTMEQQHEIPEKNILEINPRNIEETSTIPN